MAEILETIDGDLVHAEIGVVNLDRSALDGHVLLSVPQTGFAVKFDERQLRMLVHALSCGIVPYGVLPPPREESS